MKLPLGLLALATATAFSQGPLAPVAAPAPLMKTLDQIEPRIPVNATNTPGDANSLFKITQPGSYYLTANITGVVGKHGIEITASGVTLDLMGFDLAGVPGSFDGVSATVASLTDIAVLNGSVRNWGAEGLDFAGFGTTRCRVEGLRASGNVGTGIRTGNGTTVSNCSASANTSLGISTGSGSTVSNCTASANASVGIQTGNGSTVSNCSASANTTIGIQTGNACTVSNCSAFANTSVGIFTGTGSTVSHCSAYDNTGVGIDTSTSCTISNCSAVDNSVGIDTGAGCTISNCSASSNSSNGINAGSSSTISNCSAHLNLNNGIQVASGCTVEGCTTRSNSLDGINCTGSSVIRGNSCSSNGSGGNGAGIRVTNGDSRIEGNNCTAADLGILLLGGGNIMIRNTCSGNTINYDIFAGNRYGPIIDIKPVNLATVSGDEGPSTLTTTDANANFAY